MAKYGAVPDGWDAAVPSKNKPELQAIARKRSLRRSISQRNELKANHSARVSQGASSDLTKNLQEALLAEYKTLRKQGMTQLEARRRSEQLFNPGKHPGVTENGERTEPEDSTKDTVASRSASLGVNTAVTQNGQEDDSSGQRMSSPGVLQRFLDAIVTPSVCRRLHLQVHAIQHLRIPNDVQDRDVESSRAISVGGSGVFAVEVFVRAFAPGQDDNNGQSLNKSVPCSDSTTHLVEIPTSAHDKATAVCGIDC